MCNVGPDDAWLCRSRWQAPRSFFLVSARHLRRRVIGKAIRSAPMAARAQWRAITIPAVTQQAQPSCISRLRGG